MAINRFQAAPYAVAVELFRFLDSHRQSDRCVFGSSRDEHVNHFLQLVMFDHDW
jgi:hypothetical protein